ncbi:MAG: MFS transporter [Tissierellia bacterium]|nr:MFS transporter [Tissierellia bacterium]
MKLNSYEKKWILYDVGNSAYIMLATTILPLVFNALAEAGGISPSDYLAYWGYASSLVTLAVAFIGPIFGAIADRKDMKKKIFTLYVAIGIIGTFAFSIPLGWFYFLAVYVISKIGFTASLVFYDSMLTDVTTPDRMDKVSSHGFAWGYLGSCIPFIASLLILIPRERLGLSFQMASTIVFFINGIWWLLCTIPLYKTYRQIYYTEKKETSGTFKELMETFKEIKQSKKILLYLISYFFYIDGVYTIINMAVAYGSSLGLDSAGLLLALLVTQLVAFPCALLFSRLSDRFETGLLIKVCILAYFGITVFAIGLNTLFKFWILAVLVGMFQGSIQALSRSYFGKIIPPDKSAKYFGVYDIFGKGAAFLGTILVSLISQFTGNQSLGIAVLPVMFLIGLVLFRKSDKESVL